MRHVRGMTLAVAGAAAAVAAGVATNQVLDGEKLTWNWAYLAFGFALLAALITSYAAAPGQGGRGPARVRRRAYLRQLRASVLHMETVGIRTQSEYALKMRQVYVDVALRPKAAHETAADPGVGRTPPGPAPERRSLPSFLGDGGVYAVLGSPGSGKTTLARHTALGLCGRFRLRRRLPVLLYLRDHAADILDEDAAKDLADVAAAAGWLHGKVPASWLRGRLDRGRCVVLMDGLDEVADERDRKRVVAWVRRQAERYPSNTYVVTSRPHGYLTNPIPSTDVLQVQRFTGAQISLFLHHWYYAVECRAQDRTGKQVRAAADGKTRDLVRRLREKPALYELAANPLLLTMIANVHRYRGALPGSRADLYGEMCDALLHRRQEDRNLTDATGLRGPQKERVMRHLALHMMRERLRDIPIADARRAVRRPLRQVARDTDLTPDLFLEEIRKSGLLVEREQGVYGFAHLTLQEYLAAVQIRQQPSANAGLVTGSADDPWWRETILLWAAEVDATAVIEACLEAGTVNALTLAFDCAEEALEADPGTLERLDRLHVPPDDGDGDAELARTRKRLIAAVRASRNLREPVWLDDTTAVCAQPVSHLLYDSFIEQERTRGLRTPALGLRRGERKSGAATGMQAADAVRFTTWLNGLFDDGTVYRLPTPAEAAEAVEKLPHLSDHTIWTRERGTRLHRPHGTPWPYSPTEKQLTDFFTAIHENTGALLNLVEDCSRDGVVDLHEFLAYLHLYATDPPHARAFPLLAALGLARVFDIRAGGAEDGSSPEHPEAVDALLDATGPLAAVLHRDHPGPSTAHLLDILYGTRGSRHGITGALLEDARFTARRAALAIAAGDTALVGVAALPDSAAARGQVLDMVTEPDRARLYHETLVLAHALAGEGLGRLPRKIVMHRSPAERVGSIEDIAPGHTGFLCAIDLAHRFGTAYGADCTRILPTMALATAASIHSWSATVARRRATGRAFSPFNRFAADLVAEHRGGMAADQPVAALREILASLFLIRDRNLDSPLARTLIKHAQNLIEPVFDRTAEGSPAVLFAAAFALLAAIAQVRDAGQRQLASDLARVMASLISLAESPSGPPRNQALLLVRA
ncbi:NACHT domain-containing protein [Spirillospora sp. NPDC029432]|uniref:NACHT domain-containing protein n=1 Tax=Spirillospora sp. NPDC029432 TaxID=3154599 RepID=UPI0034570879